MKKIVIIGMTIGMCWAYIFCEEQKNVVAGNVPGKMVFSSERTEDGVMYIYLLENGKIENLGFEAYVSKFSPDGKCIAIFAEKKKQTKYLYVYDIENRKIKSEYTLQYELEYDGDWTKDGKYLIYGCMEELPSKWFNKYLMRINVDNGKEEIIRKYENVDYRYVISEIFVSPDNKRMVLTIGNSSEWDNPEKVERLHIMDIDGKHDKALWEVGSPLGWFPDGKHILMHTNSDNKGNRINDKKGRLYKLNVDTLETEIVEEKITVNYGRERLTRDGKYIYSCRYLHNPYFTYNIVMSRVGERDKEIMVTYPVPYTYHGETNYSDDSAPDWWY